MFSQCTAEVPVESNPAWKNRGRITKEVSAIPESGAAAARFFEVDHAGRGRDCRGA
jgi:hypothetical protein